MEAAKPALIRETFPVGPLQCNCTIIGDPLTRKAIVVDPGGDHELILQRLDRLGLQVVSIIHTHAHLDHFRLRRDEEAHRRQPAPAQGRPVPLGQPGDAVPTVRRALHAGAGPGPLAGRRRGTGLRLRSGTAHAGAYAGLDEFLVPRAKLLIAGDTLFRRGIGRTDLWGGDSAAIQRSIRQRLYSLDEDATVVAGHGPDTTLGEEMRENPFVRG